MPIDVRCKLEFELGNVDGLNIALRIMAVGCKIAPKIATLVLAPETLAILIVTNIITVPRV